MCRSPQQAARERAFNIIGGVTSDSTAATATASATLPRIGKVMPCPALKPLEIYPAFKPNGQRHMVDGTRSGEGGENSAFG